MAHKSPTNLNTPRNIALKKGVAPGKLAEPETIGVQPITHPAEKNTGSAGSSTIVNNKSPFKG